MEVLNNPLLVSQQQSSYSQAETVIDFQVAPGLEFLFPGQYFTPSRFKVLYGGRGGLKTWQIARALLLHAMSRKLRVLCARETLKSISESVHHELEAQITLLGIED